MSFFHHFVAFTCTVTPISGYYDTINPGKTLTIACSLLEGDGLALHRGAGLGRQAAPLGPAGPPVHKGPRHLQDPVRQRHPHQLQRHPPARRPQPPGSALVKGHRRAALPPGHVGLLCAEKRRLRRPQGRRGGGM
eukprot:scaffold454678_cov23-Prasinocladus_malaysianus.AAC.1